MREQLSRFCDGVKLVSVGYSKIQRFPCAIVLPEGNEDSSLQTSVLNGGTKIVRLCFIHNFERGTVIALTVEI